MLINALLGYKQHDWKLKKGYYSKTVHKIKIGILTSQNKREP